MCMGVCMSVCTFVCSRLMQSECILAPYMYALYSCV